MLVLAAIVGYLLIGFLLGRLGFSISLGNSPRKKRCDSYNCSDDEHFTDDYKFSATFGSLVWIFWGPALPFFLAGITIYGAVMLITRETRKEKKARLARESTKKEKEAKELAKTAGLPDIPE